MLGQRMAQYRTAPLNPPSPELITRLTAIVGPANALTDPDLQAAYLHEWRDRYVGRSALVLRPRTREEVASILALANEGHVGVVPQAGNTGLVGGQIPSDDASQIVLSVERLDRIRDVDAANSSMIVEAGVTLQRARDAAEAADRLFPLSLPSQGSCRIGGNLATNAGGVGVLSHGTTRSLVLGLEAVLADGRIWHGLKTLRKDNTGYDLRHLLIGSEGTLAVITAAALKLVPRPREVATAFVAVGSLEAVGEVFALASQAAGARLTAFEFLSRRALQFVAAHVPGARMPVSADAPWYVLFDVSHPDENGGGTATAERILAAALDAELANDAVLAQTLSQAADFWRLREGASEAQKFEGGSIKHDISVPVSSIAAFVARADALVERLCPGARPVPFGHFGDGNVHYNISQPESMARDAFLSRWDEISGEVHGLVAEMGGSISAEHGIGRMKRGELQRVKEGVELDMMRAIKSALDPNGILNPGKVL